MARSKKVRKALELRKQLKTAHKTLNALQEKHYALVGSMSMNERKEYLDLKSEQHEKEENNET